MLYKIRRFCSSPAYLLIPFIIAMIGIIGGKEALLPSMILNVQLIALLLFFCDDMLPAFLPTFCVITLGATNLAALTEFIPYIPVAFSVVAGLLFHLIRYRHPVYIGKSFYGLVATSVAVLLSGITTPLSTRDYSSLAAIYHIIGLSVGLILLYFLFASNRRENREYDPMHYFLWSMFFLGVLCAGVIFSEFITWLIPNLSDILAEKRFTATEYLKDFTYRNTITTLLVMCFPTAFYLAKRMKRALFQFFFLVCGFSFYAALLLSAARTAWICGTLLILICSVYYLYHNPLNRSKYINLLLFVGFGAFLIYVFRTPLEVIISRRISSGLIDPNEVRVKLIFRSIKDFLSHPLFGIGISSTANSDFYHAPGCISWYHMYFPQLWGSMGLLGLSAYLYQLVLRTKLLLHRPSPQSNALGLVYLGLLLYSQTDVGEFAPIPYAVISVLIFVLLEDKLKKEEGQSSSP